MPEFLRFTINKLEKELPENVLANHIFNGYTNSLLRCSSCGNSSITKEPFVDLQLELSSSISKCFQSFTQDEKLCFFCEKCNQRVNATKTMSIAKAPDALILQLKRFRSIGGAQKLNGFCKFHKYFDLSPFCEEKADYKLVAISEHQGSIVSGHYLSYCKRGNYWYEFDDSICTKITLKDVLSKNAYAIIYKRC